MRHAFSAIVLLSGLCLTAENLLAGPADDAPATPPTTVRARVLDAAAARGLGYAPGWQSQLPTLPGTEVQGLRLVPDLDPTSKSETLYAWDRSGVIMRLDAQTGDVRWTSAGVMAGRGGTGLIDVFTAPVGKAASTVGFADVNCLMLDARTGIEQGYTPYGRNPVSAAVRSGNEFVYASRAGQVVWITFKEEVIPSLKDRRPGDPVLKSTEVAAVHALPLEVHAHALKGPISAPPLLAGNCVVACSTAGDVVCFAAGSKRLAWQLQLPGGVVAQPAASDTQVFVPCRDQYLRCINLQPTTRVATEGGLTKQKKLNAGSVAWKWFTETPLERPPFLSGDRLVIQVPGMGLVALDANPANLSLTREPLWVSKAVGDGITRTGDGVLTWDAPSHTLSLVDLQTGAVRDTRTLPEVAVMRATAATNGDLLMMTSDGRVQRCPPLNPAVAPAPTRTEQAPAARTGAEAGAPAAPAPEGT